MKNKIRNKQASAMFSCRSCCAAILYKEAERSVRKSYMFATCRAMPVTRSDTEL